MRHRRGTCTYCGRRRVVTADHVPPKNLFPSPRPSNLVTVDACDACNKSFQRDDQYFGLVITAGIDESRFPAALAASVKAIKSLGRPQSRGLATHMLSTQRRTWASLPSGVVAPLLAQDVDGKRVLGTVRRIIRGLYRSHCRKRLPATHTAYALYTEAIGREARQFLAAHSAALTLLQSAPVIDIGGGIFRYSLLPPSVHPPFTFWRFCFFEKRVFLGATHPHGFGPGV